MTDKPRIVDISGVAHRASSFGLRQTRPETGAMQFGEDWPGLFLRGDNCREYWTLLESVLAAMESGRVPTMYEASHLRTLVGVLKATDQSQLDAGQSHVQQLRDYADCQPDGGE